MSARAEVELVAMRLFEASDMHAKQGHLHWYAIGTQRRDQWRLLAISVLEESLPYGSPKNTLVAWEELRPFIPNDLGSVTERDEP